MWICWLDDQKLFIIHLEILIFYLICMEFFQYLCPYMCNALSSPLSSPVISSTLLLPPVFISFIHLSLSHVFRG